MITTISDKLKQELIATNTWHENAPVSIDRLKLIDNISYIDFAGKEHQNGKMIAFDVVAENVMQIFGSLRDINFPVARIALLNDYNGDDNLSMAVNNTSCFNPRYIAGTNRYSIHAYGLAIDLNPVQNPLISKKENGELIIEPEAGRGYLDRDNLRPGMITGKIIAIFKSYGFNWGGYWSEPVDLHHFEIPSSTCEKLINMSYEDGLNFFNKILLT